MVRPVSVARAKSRSWFYRRNWATAERVTSLSKPICVYDESVCRASSAVQDFAAYFAPDGAALTQSV